MRSPVLSQEQIAAFRRDGFLSPIDAFSEAEVRAWRAALEDYERTLPAPSGSDRKYTRKLHTRLPCARDIAEDPRILDVMEQLLGPDILAFQSTFFIKEPNTDAVAAWHQDATYFGLEPHEHVTAWVALSDASEAAGCMQFVRGSHLGGQRRHAPGRVAGSVNGGSQTIAEHFDTEGLTAHAPLRPGQLSLHHTLVVHSSAPNRGNDRRIGYGISYIPTRVRYKGRTRMPATLVRGIDRYGHFALEPDPRLLSPEERAAAHERAFAAYRAGYAEQIAQHSLEYA